MVNKGSERFHSFHFIAPILILVILSLHVFLNRERDFEASHGVFVALLFLSLFSIAIGKSRKLVFLGLIVVICCLVSIITPFLTILEPVNHYTAFSTGFIQQKNVLLISIDTLRADHLGCYGHPQIKTPNIDRFAKKSCLFEQINVPIALTVPSHASILTGLFPEQHGSHSNGDPIEEKKSLITFFRERGYFCGGIVSGYPLKKQFFSLAQQFQWYNDKFSPAWFPPDAIFSLPVISLLANSGLIYDRRFLFERKGDGIIDELMKRIDGITMPLFLFVHFYEPHGPYEPPDIYRKMYYSGNPTDPSNNSMKSVAFPPYQRLRKITDVAYPRQMYKGEISSSDALIGVFLKKFFQKISLADTTVVLTADHGESLGEHDYYFDHGADIYQPSLHVPLLISFPLQNKCRIQSTVLGNTIIASFFMSSTTPDLDAPEPEVSIELNEKGSLLSESAIPLEANSNLLNHSSESILLRPYMRGVIKGRYKYVQDFTLQKELLFDRWSDPEEKINVMAEHEDLVIELKGSMEHIESSISSEIPLEKDHIEMLQELGYIQ